MTGRTFSIVKGKGLFASNMIYAEIQNIDRQTPGLLKRISEIELYLSGIDDVRRKLDAAKIKTPISKEQIESLEQRLLDADQDEISHRERLEEAKENYAKQQARMAELRSELNVEQTRWTFDLDNFPQEFLTNL